MQMRTSSLFLTAVAAGIINHAETVVAACSRRALHASSIYRLKSGSSQTGAWRERKHVPFRHNEQCNAPALPARMNGPEGYAGRRRSINLDEGISLAAICVKMQQTCGSTFARRPANTAVRHSDTRMTRTDFPDSLNIGLGSSL